MDIPIGLNLADQKVTSPLDQALHNVTVGDMGVSARAAFSTLADLGTAAQVDGLYDWREQSVVVVVTGGEVYKITDAVGGNSSFLRLEDASGNLLLEDGFKLLLENQPTPVDVSGAVAMNSNNLVTFANFGEALYMANGGKIQVLGATQSGANNGGNDYTCDLSHLSTAASEPGVGVDWTDYWTLVGAGSTYDAWATGESYYSGTADVLEDTDAPTEVSFIAAADAYLLALQNETQRVWFSVVEEPLSWNGDFFDAEHLPDEGTCMIAHDGDLWVGGSRSIQSFVNDGVTPWVTSGYGPVSQGVLAPYSFLYCREVSTFVWIDESRRVVALQGRQPQSISHALDTWMDEVPAVGDAQAQYVVIDGVPYYLLYFPTSEQAVAVNLRNNTFVDYTNDSGPAWNVGKITNVPAWDMVIGGHRSDGLVLDVSTDYTQDDSTDVDATIRTPRVQTGQTARVSTLRLHFKRVYTPAGAGSASISVRWRDDDGAFSTARTVTISDNSVTDAVKEIYRLGAYRNYRQYEFDCSDLHPYALMRVEQL